MKEIRIHGRGGQGAVTAAYILASAAYKAGKYPQAFPSFGVERRGAPVVSFVRVDDKPVRVRTQVYKPNYLIIFDSSLPKEILLHGTNKKTILVINSKKLPEELGIFQRAISIDASKEAMEVLGRDIVNTAMIGAFAAFTGEFKISALKSAIKEHFSGAIRDKNLTLVDRVYKKTLEKMKNYKQPKGKITIPKAKKERKLLSIGAHVPKPGSSVKTKTGTWRSIRPVVDKDLCIGCGLCAKFCPENSIEIVKGKAVIDYNYCKGCGICAAQCPKKAITMKEEQK